MFGLCIIKSFLSLLDFGKVANISSGNEESSELKRFAGKWMRSQVGSFSKEEHFVWVRLCLLSAGGASRCDG